MPHSPKGAESMNAYLARALASVATCKSSSQSLADQLRQRPVIADEVLRAAREVGELRGGDIDSQPLIERGEDVAEMDRPGARLLAPARRRAEDLPAPQAAAGHQRAGNRSANGRGRRSC